MRQVETFGSKKPRAGKFWWDQCTGALAAQLGQLAEARQKAEAGQPTRLDDRKVDEGGALPDSGGFATSQSKRFASGIAGMSTNRRLAAIMVADVVGYSRMMEADEAGTLAALKERRKAVLEPVVKAHGGRIVKVMGDGVLVEFGSAVNAVQGAIELQKQMAAANEGVPTRRSGSSCASASILAMSSARARTSMARGSISRRGWRRWRSRAASASRGKVHERGARQDRCRLSRTWASRSSRTSTQPVRVYRSGAADRRWPRPLLTLPDKPSIAVLPFQNMSGDPEQEYFADGMVEEIITALSRFAALFVIARNSSFTYKGRAVDVKQVGRELGVRYVLEGSVRKAAQPGAHHRAVDRCGDRRASVGGSIRWRAGGYFRPAGPGDGERGRRDRAEARTGRDRAVASASRPEASTPMTIILRGMAARSPMDTGGDRGGARAVRQGDRARSEIRFRLWHGGALLCRSARPMAGWSIRGLRSPTAGGWRSKAAELGKDDAVALARAGHALAYRGGRSRHVAPS